MALYNLEGESTDTPLYSNIKSPFAKKVLPFKAVEASAYIPEKLEDMSLKRVDLLSKFQNIVPTDNTFIRSPELPVELKSSSTSIKLPEILQLGKTFPTSKFDFNKFRELTGKQESNNTYNPTKQNGDATGKYQFKWRYWGKEIMHSTGLNRQQFLRNPKAQESFFEKYSKQTIEPAVKKLAALGSKNGLTQTELARIVHFQGSTGAERALSKGIEGMMRKTSHNPSIMKYLGK